MKKLIVLFSAIAFASCSTVKVGYQVTSFETFPNGASIGVHVHGQGSYKPQIDSLMKGYSVWIAGQKLQITHTDTSVDINAILNLQYK